MSAADGFARDGVDPYAAEPREPIDWDRRQAVIDAIGIRVLYLAGIVLAVLGLADAFGWGPAGVVLLVASGVPGALQHREATRRRKEREDRARQAEFHGPRPSRSPDTIQVRP